MKFQLDRGILLSVLFLIGLGLVQVYSSSYIFATEVHHDGLLFFRKQLIFSAFAIAMMLSVAMMPWKWAERAGLVLWLCAVIGVMATFIPGVGIRVGGAHRWIGTPFGFRLEPAELLRVTYPFAFSLLISRFAKGDMDRSWWMLLTLVLAPMGLLLLQPDFGSFVIVGGLAFCLFVAFGWRWRYIFSLAAVSVPILAYLIMSTHYRRVRFEAFLDPWADQGEKGFQVIQSLLSFYSGGLTGVGLGLGQGKLFFLPEAHTDFTLAVLGEEMGYVGFFLLLMVYGFLVFRGFQIALLLRKYRERCLALALSLILAFSVLINVGVTLALLPTKGLTLPLISYGGSSLVCTALLIAWLLNLERESKVYVSFRQQETD